MRIRAWIFVFFGRFQSWFRELFRPRRRAQNFAELALGRALSRPLRRLPNTRTDCRDLYFLTPAPTRSLCRRRAFTSIGR